MQVGCLLHYKKYFPYALALALMPYLFIKAWGGGDFNTYLAAAEKLKHGENCYNVWLSYGHSNVPLQYGYSPFFALLLVPFTYLPVWLPQFMFLIACVFMVVRVLKILIALLEIEHTPFKTWWVVLVLACTLRFILHNFEMVQLNIFILWLTVEGLYQIFFKQRIVAGALLIGLGINFKILPLVFLPYLVYRRQGKAACIVLGFTGLLWMLPAIFWGLEFNTQLLHDWFHIINPMNEKYMAGQNNDSYRLHGLAALFAAYFSKSTSEHYQFLVYPLSNEVLTWLINGSRVLVVLFTLYFLRTLPFKQSLNKQHFVLETAYLFLVTPLIFPQQNKWAFVYLLPAFGYVFFVLLKSEKRGKTIWLLLLSVFVLTTLTTDGLGKTWGYYADCLKLITIGSMLLIPVLIGAERNVNEKAPADSKGFN